MTSNPSTPDTDGPKTETTLTTRIRINIPGSRPIPPVVVRKPVKDTAQPAGPEPTEAAPAPAPAPVRPAPPVRSALPPAAPAAPGPAPAAPAPEPEEAASNWFAPR
ncbi:hypothetical protein ABZZ17_05980, partial [Streptomyces sp. NPDC006512]